MRSYRQNKLWRDKMPAYCEAQGSIIITKPLDDKEFDRELRIKLLEEADEVKEAKSRQELIEELANIYEVIGSLISLHKIEREDILSLQEKKRIEKGGFMERAFVTIVTHPIGRYSDAYCQAHPEK